MPAKSQAQQRFMGMVHAEKEGTLDKSKLDPEFAAKIEAIAKRIKAKKAEEYAETKHKGLPEEVKKASPPEGNSQGQKLAEKNPRIPRKKGQPALSKKHSDLYTDENPKGTIQGLRFVNEKEAVKSVSKIKNSGKKHAHKIQAAIAMEQRARVAGKSKAAAVYRRFIEDMKKITKERNKTAEVNAAGNYTHPEMRKRIYKRILASNKGGKSGQ